MDNLTIESWLDQLGGKTPTPGGGAAAALLAATGAALIEMVTIYTTGERWSDRESTMLDINRQARRLRDTALQLAQADAHAFTQVGHAYKLPRSTDEEKLARAQAIEDALVGAAGPPQQIGLVAVSIIDLAEKLLSEANPNVISDIAVAASSAEAALQAAIVNIDINAHSLNDPYLQHQLLTTVEELTPTIARARTIVDQVRKAIAQ